MNPEQIGGLADSMQAHELAAPIEIRVFPNEPGRTPELNFGGHRFEVAKQIDRATIQAVLVKMTDAEALCRRLRENFARVDLEPQQRDEWLRQLQQALIAAAEETLAGDETVSGDTVSNGDADGKQSHLRQFPTPSSRGGRGKTHPGSVANVAKKSGVSKSTVARALSKSGKNTASKKPKFEVTKATAIKPPPELDGVTMDDVRPLLYAAGLLRTMASTATGLKMVEGLFAKVPNMDAPIKHLYAAWLRLEQRFLADQSLDATGAKAAPAIPATTPRGTGPWS